MRRLLVVVLSFCALASTQSDYPSHRASANALHFKAAGENSRFEWFFLLTDAGDQQGIWAKNGVDPQWVPTPGSAAELKERVASGTKIGFVNTAEVLLARSTGVPVKVVAGYFGPTIAKILVKADGPLRDPKDLDGKRIGILSTTHTSYRAVLYLNHKLGIKTEPVAIGSLDKNLAALKAGTIDAFYSAEGAALPLVDSGELRILIRLADIYPKPYTAVVVWASDDLIAQQPDVVRKFVAGTLDTVHYLEVHPERGSEIYVARTHAPKALADRAVAELNTVLSPSGRGSGQDLLAAVRGSWQFTQESGFELPAGTQVRVDEAVDSSFLPKRSGGGRARREAVRPKPQEYF